jgi:hypothetical protein
MAPSSQYPVKSIVSLNICMPWNLDKDIRRSASPVGVHPEMVFLSNPPVEDAAGGEEDKSLRPPLLPHGTFYLFYWGEMLALVKSALNI